jgi:hypothetical protein
MQYFLQTDQRLEVVAGMVFELGEEAGSALRPGCFSWEGRGRGVADVVCYDPHPRFLVFFFFPFLVFVFLRISRL